MYRIYKELSPKGDGQEYSVIKELVGSYSVYYDAEEKLLSIYEDTCNNRHATISGTTIDFQFESWDYRFLKDLYYNCIVHYWIEEIHFVNNGAEKIDISGLDYDSIDDFFFGRSVVAKKGKYGLIDVNFNLILGLYYKRITRFMIEPNIHEPICLVIYSDDEVGYVDLNGQFVVVIGNPKTEEAWLSSIGRIPSKNVMWAYKSECKWVRVELKSPSWEYESAYSFYNVETQSFPSSLYQGGKHILFAKSNYVNGMAIIQNHFTGKVGAINMSGLISIPVIYDELSIFADNGVAVFCEDAKEVVEHFTPARYLNFRYKKGGKWGAIDVNGEIRIPAQYDYAYAFSDELAAVNLGGEYYVYLSQEPSFYLDSFIPQDIREDSFTRWFMGGKWGFVDENGNECIPIQYDKVSRFRNGISIVNKGGRWIGGSLRNRYDLPKYSQQMPAFIEGKYGIINQKGELIVPLIYTSLSWDDNTPNPTYLRGLIGGEYIEEDEHYYIVDPEKEVYLSPDGKVIEEFPCGENIRWPV